MARRKRTYKILTALAGSMVGGTLLLAGSQPGGLYGDGKPAVLLHARGASEREAGAGWDRIVVLMDADEDFNSLSVNSLRTHPESHILIDAAGLLSLQPAWLLREPVVGSESAIVVRCESGEVGRESRGVQSETLNLLLTRLESEFGLTREAVEFRESRFTSSDRP